MATFRVVPIDPTISDQARTSLRSPQYGHPAHAEPAKGYGPCRSCLRRFLIGEDRRLLFTYNPFAGLDSYPSPGPIFIHENSCQPYQQESIFPPELRTLPLTLEGYGKDRWLISRERPAETDLEAAIERLLTHSEIDYIHVRNTEAGCFVARIERA
jgi:Protein of unknown function (DUF1203)